MITVKDLMQTSIQSSPDGEHWEPALPMPLYYLPHRLRDAYAVWTGEATAIRQTKKADLIDIGAKP
jgi:hypothetical protein